jgi:hypothetical protein
VLVASQGPPNSGPGFIPDLFLPVEGPHKTPETAIAAFYGQSPIGFEANRGQTDPSVKFLSRGAGYTLYLTADEAVLALRARSQKAYGKGPSSESRGHARALSPPATPIREGAANNGQLNGNSVSIENSHSSIANSPSRSVVRMRLTGANPEAQVTGIDALRGRSNYFIGNDPTKWRTSVPQYAKVRYEGVYPGVDLVYYGNQRQLEYDFVVAPGADPRAIRFEVETNDSKSEIRGIPNPTSQLLTADSLRIDANGDLVISSDGDVVRFRKPVVYQEKQTAKGRESGAKDNKQRTNDLLNPGHDISNRQYLDAQYKLRIFKAKTESENPKYEVSFELASYDPALPLIIDPVLSYSTYLGGSAADNAAAVAVDAAGSAYITGSTTSADFPVVNALQAAINRTQAFGNDTFVTKLSLDGTSIIYSTFLGGSNGDVGHGIAVDSQGNVYVAGETSSSDFPVTQGAFQTTYRAAQFYGGDGFIAKLNPTGSSLVYSTYFGGNGQDLINGVAVDANGNAYITGATSSSDLPITLMAPQPTIGREVTGICPLGTISSCGDAFVAEINPQGTNLVYATYLGGSEGDYAYGIAVDSAASAYVVGATNSRDFPTTPGSYQSGMTNSPSNAFITKLKPQGTGLAFSTFLGGNGGLGALGDEGHAIAVDSQGHAYVAGTTYSIDFPTVNAFQPKQA